MWWQHVVTTMELVGASLMALAALCQSLYFVWLHVSFNRRLSEMDGRNFLSLLCRQLGSAKLPDKAFLDWAEVRDLNDCFWDDFNLLYPELERCPQSEPLFFDFWNWNKHVGLRWKLGKANVRFDVTLVLSFEKLQRMGLADEALWRISDDPRYETFDLNLRTQVILPKDSCKPDAKNKADAKPRFRPKKQSKGPLDGKTPDGKTPDGKTSDEGTTETGEKKATRSSSHLHSSSVPPSVGPLLSAVSPPALTAREPESGSV